MRVKSSQNKKVIRDVINHKLSLLYSRNHFIQEPRINTKRKRFVNLILPDISESWAIVEKKKMIACVLFSLP